jgi:hypothetical protein
LKKIELIKEHHRRTEDLIPNFKFNTKEHELLEYKKPNLIRCSRCILPETMPFIHFNNDGVCNYCLNYKKIREPKSKKEILDFVKPYRNEKGNDCIVAFSGGRDSCYALHLIVNELKLKPIAYTYDWGMVTDLGRRNISRFCAELGVENIIVSANITKKRKYIRHNLKAWLRKPHLGMISLLTAGDKHFFKHIKTIKKETGLKLNLWGTNPLEVTHFKSGFLGIKPQFRNTKVYVPGLIKQFKYHSKRFSQMVKNPYYFNSSLFDTLSGEYYRSIDKKSDYFNIFDFWRWDEAEVDSVLAKYNWEKAIDTSCTW